MIAAAATCIIKEYGRRAKSVLENSENATTTTATFLSLRATRRVCFFSRAKTAGAFSVSRLSLSHPLIRRNASGRDEDFVVAIEEHARRGAALARSHN